MQINITKTNELFRVEVSSRSRSLVGTATSLDEALETVRGFVNELDWN